MDTTILSRPVAEIVTQSYQTAAVFERFGIDFCCGGKRPLAEVCEAKGIDTEEIVQALAEALEDGSTESQRFDQWDLGLLIGYIVQQHHQYVREALPRLKFYVDKVAARHGERYPESVRIAERFQLLTTELENHLVKEEQSQFPRIAELSRQVQNGEQVEDATKQWLADLNSELEQEHESAGAIMQEIRRLTSDFTPPESACTTHRLAYQELEAFESDLHRHVHLENNILFPRALELC